MIDSNRISKNFRLIQSHSLRLLCLVHGPLIREVGPSPRLSLYKRRELERVDYPYDPADAEADPPPEGPG